MLRLQAQQSLARRLLQLVNRRNISTSKKNRDTIDITHNAEQNKSVASTKNWVSYGFEHKSEFEDRRAMHSVFFASVTVCLVFGSFYLAYVPNFNLTDWSQREAYLELKRREDAGLPLVDCNLIDPARITLPSEDELGDTEIII